MECHYSDERLKIFKKSNRRCSDTLKLRSSDAWKRHYSDEMEKIFLKIKYLTLIACYLISGIPGSWYGEPIGPIGDAFRDIEFEANSNTQLI